MLKLGGRSEEKTNVMRLLEQKKIPYESYHADIKEAVSGVEAARIMGLDAAHVFKTLVTRGKSGQLYVFVIPAAAELDLKKAASVSGEKSVAMILSRELLPNTGYVHGGCSPIGMKKVYPTFLDDTAQHFDTICFSAGRIGYQVEIKPDDLGKIIRFRYTDITVD